MPLRARQLQKLTSSLLSHRVPNACEKPERIRERTSEKGKTSCLGETPAEVSTAGRMEQPPPGGCCFCRRDAAAAGTGMPLLPPVPWQSRCRGPSRAALSRREGVGVTSCEVRDSTYHHRFRGKTAADNVSFSILTSYVLLQLKKFSLTQHFMGKKSHLSLSVKKPSLMHLFLSEHQLP